MKRLFFLAAIQGLAAWLASVACAQPGASDSYAIVVGSNLGGPGQEALRFAEEDANRVADLLVELGSYPPEHIDRLVQPSASDLLAAVERAQRRFVPLAREGKQFRFFFYYSGHARADALNLGSQELPLSVLRDQLLQLPATLSIVVLDACQSGAFSRVKGAGPAADFSFNSVERLNTEGIVRIALGFGERNNDAMMERVSNAGNGIYSVLYNPDQATAYAHQRLLSTMFHVAKDLKIQVEFNPERVYAYRLIGYEDRAVADDLFRDDAVDGGEVGAGHRATALYEVALESGDLPDNGQPPSRGDVEAGRRGGSRGERARAGEGSLEETGGNEPRRGQ
jgi:hypothetical protein